MYFFQLPIILGLYLKQALVAQLVERLSFGSAGTGSNPVGGHEFVGKGRHWFAFVLPQIHFLSFRKARSAYTVPTVCGAARGMSECPEPDNTFSKEGVLVPAPQETLWTN